MSVLEKLKDRRVQAALVLPLIALALRAWVAYSRYEQNTVYLDTPASAAPAPTVRVVGRSVVSDLPDGGTEVKSFDQTLQDTEEFLKKYGQKK